MEALKRRSSSWAKMDATIHSSLLVANNCMAQSHLRFALRLSQSTSVMLDGFLHGRIKCILMNKEFNNFISTDIRMQSSLQASTLPRIVGLELNHPIPNPPPPPQLQGNCKNISLINEPSCKARQNATAAPDR
ncbi:hypothetical protein T05_13668 [Trichinella murrelli]|uniref:Uncharacterized protein n=1 Tax=Trichinella murrelli TaxID=144512 RepID=A0A0V0TDU6_9BILA|nr:hypothetical protein T05_13668 [Trichinella murrelli]